MTVTEFRSRSLEPQIAHIDNLQEFKVGGPPLLLVPKARWQKRLASMRRVSPEEFPRKGVGLDFFDVGENVLLVPRCLSCGCQVVALPEPRSESVLMVSACALSRSNFGLDEASILRYRELLISGEDDDVVGEGACNAQYQGQYVSVCQPDLACLHLNGTCDFVYDGQGNKVGCTTCQYSG